MFSRGSCLTLHWHRGFQLALHLARPESVYRDEAEALRYARLALDQGYEPDPTDVEEPLSQAMAFLLQAR